jgi:hypothetical protein
MADVYQCKHLVGRRFETFLKVADRIIPPDEKDPGGGIPQVAGVADWAIAHIDPALRKRLMVFLTVFEYMGYLFGLKPFSRLSAERRDRQLRWLERSPIPVLRMAFFGLKTYACMGYYSLESVWPSIGYGGPLVPDRAFPDQVIRDLQQGRLEVRG